MSEPHSGALTPSTVVVPTQPPPSKLLAWLKGRNVFERYGRHVLAILFWGYGLCQLFIFDFDSWLIAHLPEGFRWIIVYKLLVFLFFAAVILNFVSRRRFWSWAAYVLLYPFMGATLFIVFVAWILFKLKSWTALFAVLNVTISFFAGFKANLLIYVIAAIGVVTTLVAMRPGDLISATLLLVITVFMLTGRRLVSIFQRSPIFNVYVRAMAWIMDYSRRNLIKPSSLKGVDVTALTLTELEQRYGQLSTAIFLSELCGFLEVKFKQYRDSNIGIATNLLALVGLLGIVIVLLGFANFALYRAQSSAFYVLHGHNLFDFVYYAFGAVTGQRSGEIVPASLGAKLLSMLAILLGLFFLAGTALSLILSIWRHNDDADIERAIQRLGEERNRMNQFVEEKFSLPLNDAIAVLEGIKGGLSAAIKVLRAAQGN